MEGIDLVAAGRAGAASRTYIHALIEGDDSSRVNG